MKPVTDPEALREHAYMLLQRDAKLLPADCRFYEQEVRQRIETGRAFTADEVSREVNGQLAEAGRTWLRLDQTEAAVHLLVKVYACPAEYRSERIDLGDGRVTPLYYPDEAGRRQWESARIPITQRATAKSLPPKSYLTSWREILAAVGMANNKTSRTAVKKLNRTYAGPIVTPKQGAQPKADKAKLLEWWNGLEQQFLDEQQRKSDAEATVAEQHPYGKDGIVVPGISGRVKRRRGSTG
jgi:hypothetical protein